MNIIAGIVFLPLGKALGKILNIIVNILIYISKITAKIPLSFFTIKTPSIVVLIEYYILVYCVLKKKKIKEMFIITIITIIILNAISLIPGSLEIHMVDVGQRRLHGYKNTS